MLLKMQWSQYMYAVIIATHNSIMYIHNSIIDIHNPTYGYP